MYALWKKDKTADDFAQVGLLNIKERLLLSVEKQANKISFVWEQ